MAPLRPFCEAHFRSRRRSRGSAGPRVARRRAGSQRRPQRGHRRRQLLAGGDAGPQVPLPELQQLPQPPRVVWNLQGDGGDSGHGRCREYPRTPQCPLTVPFRLRTRRSPSVSVRPARDSCAPRVAMGTARAAPPRLLSSLGAASGGRAAWRGRRGCWRWRWRRRERRGRGRVAPAWCCCRLAAGPGPTLTVRAGNQRRGEVGPAAGGLQSSWAGPGRAGAWRPRPVEAGVGSPR